ncbi:hypothetical protein L207DRAFT_530231 [Hyaloscypha variabilis F]|uniref:Extracellular membrane protein CFEM domain-containing protein n=1 Tax=Hyaloscypha variabilis (strain UAMH 11265 / GT02V1 / F) TaxID=1149755 RepID=A0A2J6RJU0_HYAVF|nr:hypothetical protein L207DRAFT_530231 [Hyaloscypha variabilis F]
MCFHDLCPTYLLYGLLFCLSLTRAQDTLPQTIFSLPVFSSQKPCAQACFTTGPLGYCFEDMVGDALGCVTDNACGLGSKALAPNDCYCRTDLQSVAESFLTSCVQSSCTVGDSSIDISSAGSIYLEYCSSQGFPINVPASTTQEIPQATTTVASPSLQQTSPTNSGVSSAPGSSSSSTTNPNAATTPNNSNKLTIALALGLGIPTIVVAILTWWCPCIPCGHRRAKVYSAGRDVRLNRLHGSIRS